MTAVCSEMFTRPHKCCCAGFVDIAVTYAALEACASFDVWRDRLQQELEEVYGGGETTPRVAVVRYSTAAYPEQFSSEVNAATFGLVAALAATTAQQTQWTEQHEQTTQALATMEAERDVTANRVSRREREATQKANTELRTAKREMAKCAAEIEHLHQKLANTKRMCCVRVFVN